MSKEEKHKGNLLSSVNNKVWKTPETEQLEHELEKEIAVRKYKNSRDEEYRQQIDENLDHSLEQNMDTMQNEKERRPSNLFRYESKRSWDTQELDEQEQLLQQQMEYLAKKQQL